MDTLPQCYAAAAKFNANAIHLCHIECSIQSTTFRHSIRLIKMQTKWKQKNREKKRKTAQCVNLLMRANCVRRIMMIVEAVLMLESHRRQQSEKVSVHHVRHIRINAVIVLFAVCTRSGLDLMLTLLSRNGLPLNHPRLSGWIETS